MGRISRIVYDVLLLRHAVQTVRMQDQILVESVVEQAKTAAQHGFRRVLSPSADTPRKAQPWRPVRMIVNRVLGFKAQAAAQRESGTHLPVILYVQSGIHHRHRHGGRCAARAIDEELAGHKSLVILIRRKGIGAIESGVRGVDLMNCPQPSLRISGNACPAILKCNSAVRNGPDGRSRFPNWRLRP